VSARFHPHHAHVAQAPLELLERGVVKEPVAVSPDDERGSADARKVRLQEVRVLRAAEVLPDDAVERLQCQGLLPQVPVDRARNEGALDEHQVDEAVELLFPAWHERGLALPDLHVHRARDAGFDALRLEEGEALDFVRVVMCEQATDVAAHRICDEVVAMDCQHPKECAKALGLKREHEPLGNRGARPSKAG
jgi:hypothetical protein